MADDMVPGTDTYATLAEADAYMSTRLGASAWDSASEADKLRALRGAFRRMERLPYEGTPAEAAQTAKWPREGIRDQHGEELPTDEYPCFLIEAQTEEALYLLQTQAQALGDSTREQLQAQGVTRIKMGDVEEQYDLSRMQGRSGTFLGPEALAIIGRYLRRTPARVRNL